MEFFLRLRAIAFCLIAFVSFIWIILLCLDLVWQADLMDPREQSLIGVILFNDTVTLIMLLILLLLPFRPWLDAARFMFLLLSHIGTAAAFSYWGPKFKCPAQSPDQMGVCNLLNFYILVASWVIPVLLIAYVSGLALMVYRRSQVDALMASKPEDEETDIGRRSGINPETRQLDMTPMSISSPVNIISSQTPTVPNQSASISAGDSRFSTSTGRSARLSKPMTLPGWMF